MKLLFTKHSVSLLTKHSLTKGSMTPACGKMFKTKCSMASNPSPDPNLSLTLTLILTLALSLTLNPNQFCNEGLVVV